MGKINFDKHLQAAHTSKGKREKYSEISLQGVTTNGKEQEL